MLLHEYFHGLVAKKLGYKIGKIKLLATGAALEAESDEFSFDDEIKIAISGPLFNLILPPICPQKPNSFVLIDEQKAKFINFEITNEKITDLNIQRC